MNLLKLKIWLGAFALIVCLGPSVGWSTRLADGAVTGQVTATPLAGEIEVDHRVYYIAHDSPAAKALHEFSAGLTVDIVLDGPADSSASRVVSITRHAGT